MKARRYGFASGSFAFVSALSCFLQWEIDSSTWHPTSPTGLDVLGPTPVIALLVSASIATVCAVQWSPARGARAGVLCAIVVALVGLDMARWPLGAFVMHVDGGAMLGQWLAISACYAACVFASLFAMQSWTESGRVTARVVRSRRP